MLKKNIEAVERFEKMYNSYNQEFFGMIEMLLDNKDIMHHICEELRTRGLVVDTKENLEELYIK